MSSGWVLQVVVTVNAGKGRVGVMSFPIMQQSSLRDLRGWNVRVFVGISFFVCFLVEVVWGKEEGGLPTSPQ